jgi:SAM-dependent methyltransferase
VKSDPFDDLSDVYEAMIDWPKRLANEEPFYRQLFERVGARRVVDAACGTGQHAAMFHRWGLEVEGADVSRRMIDRARTTFGKSDGLRWIVRGFDEPVETSETPRDGNRGGLFDVAICVGNSLALAPDMDTVHRAVRAILAAVRVGGAVVIHVLNLWHLPEGPVVWQKCTRASLAQGESLIVKGVHRCGANGFVELIVANLESQLMLRTDAPKFLGLEASGLAEIAKAAGAAQVDIFGGYRGQPYERETSVDLVVIAWK